MKLKIGKSPIQEMKGKTINKSIFSFFNALNVGIVQGLNAIIHWHVWLNKNKTTYNHAIKQSNICRTLKARVFYKYHELSQQESLSIFLKIIQVMNLCRKT